jgi:hypothetical protein
VWALLLEWCAEVVAATASGRRLPPLVAAMAATLVGLVLAVSFGPRGLLPLVGLVVIVFAAARDVFVAREEAFHAAHEPLDAPGQRPTWRGDPRLTAPSAVALHQLARAIDAARHGQYADASDLVPLVDRDLLRTEELRLLDAVRALVSCGLGDDARAAQQAVVALPTGCDAIDQALGRVVLARAWDDPERLRVIDAAWSRAGVPLREPGSLPELRRLARLRIDPATGGELGAADALALAEHARAVGDDGLAVDLELRGRQGGAYR